MNSTSICLVAVANHTIIKYLHCEPRQFKAPVEVEFDKKFESYFTGFFVGLFWHGCLLGLGFALELFVVGLERFKLRIDDERRSGKVRVGGEWDWVLDVQRRSKKTDDDQSSLSQDSDTEQPTCAHSADAEPPAGGFAFCFLWIYWIYLFVAWIGRLEYSPSWDLRVWVVMCGLAVTLCGWAFLEHWFEKRRQVSFPRVPSASSAAKDLESGTWERKQGEKAGLL
ncbi:hypothetical protein LTR10_006945 [Elasticomyces elasticus]|nr:hypothetical protein LTR10_006945 [Elasticomyces elasticus]KAK4972656.1 hypothetical protein LTR42_005949 [Elasticomyces elasticus]